MGPNCTLRVVQEQLKKLKKMATLEASGAAPKATVTKVGPTHPSLVITDLFPQPAKAANIPAIKAKGKAAKAPALNRLRLVDWSNTISFRPFDRQLMISVDESAVQSFLASMSQPPVHLLIRSARDIHR